MKLNKGTLSHNAPLSRGQVLSVAVLMMAFGAVQAANTGLEFQGLYTFVYDAATGYLGRSIAIIGGLIGMGFGAASGKALPAIIGIILAIFGALGPTIIDSIFNTALI